MNDIAKTNQKINRLEIITNYKTEHIYFLM